MTKKTIGIFGGTFDPIHEGHRRIAKALLAGCQLDEIQFIPCGNPVHRNQPMASAQDRLAMLKLALENEASLTINTCEIERPGPSYAIDTLHLIKKENPKSSLCLILGLDAFSQFKTWRNPEEILTLANLIVVNRSETSDQELPKTHRITDPNALQSPPSGLIYFYESANESISATHIRHCFKEHRSEQVKQNLAPAVYNYIMKRHLYDNF